LFEYASIDDLVALDDEAFDLHVMALAEAHGKIQWQIGDYARAYTIKGAHRDGADAEASTREFAERYGWDYGEIKQCRWVAEAYEVGTRVPTLGWSHHRALAARPDRLDWLAQAAEQRISVKTMLAAIEEADEATRQEEERARRNAERERRFRDANIDPNDPDAFAKLAEIEEQARDEEQRRLDHEGQVRRASERLRQLLIGWIELEALPTNPDREAILLHLSAEQRSQVEAIERMYSHDRYARA
jgi:hypothetical protein